MSLSWEISNDSHNLNSGGVAHRGESSGNFRVGTSLGSYADKGYVTI